MKKHKVLKIVGITYLVIGLIFILPLSLTVRAYTGTNPVFMAGTQIKSYSYGLWRQGSTYYATSGITGQVDYSGTNASSLVQSCVNQLTSGGKIFFQTGLYDFDSQVSVPYSIVFEGEGTMQSQIRLITPSIYLFNVSASDVVFRGLYFNGNAEINGSGLRFGAGSNFPLVSSCRFYNFNDTAIVVFGSGGTNILGRVEHSTFWSCDYGIKINANSGYWANDWVIFANRFQTIATQALQIGIGDGVARGARILANTIENSPTGIRLGNNSGFARVSFNRIENCSSYGIYIINTPNYLYIAGNYFADANITVSSIGSVNYVAYNDGNWDYVSFHHYFNQATAPTAPTPVNGSLWWDSDGYLLYTYNGTNWNES